MRYRHTVYVVIALGDAALPAEDLDLAAVQAALGERFGFRSHRVTNRQACRQLTEHLVGQVAAGAREHPAAEARRDG